MDGPFLEIYIYIFVDILHERKGKNKPPGIPLFEILAPLPQDLSWAQTPCGKSFGRTEVPVWKLSWAFCAVSTRPLPGFDTLKRFDFFKCPFSIGVKCI